MSTATESSDLVSSPPRACSESRGSSVSSEMREEYEDLLRYAVVMPVAFDAKMAFREKSSVQNQTPLQPQPVPVTRLQPPRPLFPEVKAVDFEEDSTLCSDSSSTDLEEHLPRTNEPPVTSQAPPTNYPPADLNQSLSLQASLTTPTFFKPSAPYTAMNVQSQQQVRPTSVTHDQARKSHDVSHDDRPPISHDTPRGRHDFNPVWAQDPMGEDSNDSIKVQAQLVDPEMSRLGTQMDVWCHDLKRNILAEFEQSRIRLIECQLAQFRQERERRSFELKQAREELERYKELLVTYEQSISRKDHIIANLTRSIQKQKERVDLQRTFNSWKLRLLDDKREAFTSTLARSHHHRVVKRHVWEAWAAIIHGRWKQRVEKACQMKAKEICMELTDQYEEKLASVQQCLEDSRQEVVALQAQRDLYEENMKKAFMRGVCALNLEAMTMFKYNDDTASASGDLEALPHQPPPTIFPSEGDETQRAQLAAHMRHVQSHHPATIADMRPIRATECLTVAPKSVHISTSHAMDRPTAANSAHLTTPMMPASVLPSKVHHQHVLNRQGVQAGQYPGDEGGGACGGGRGSGRQCGRCVRGGTKPPAVFVQRHSE